MTKDTKAISEFLSTAPLYKKIQVDTNFMVQNSFDKITFDFHCNYCNDVKTFQLEAYPAKFPLNHSLPNRGLHFSKDFKENDYISQQYKGVCRHCNKNHIDILLNTFSEEKEKTQTRINYKVYLHKIGQYPPFEITPEIFIINYLNEEDQVNYKKALICLSQKYGIAAYAYLRRIVENEIIKIIDDISKLDFPDAKKIAELLESYKQNHQMTNLIDGAYQYMPGSLKTLGNNPFKVLHSQLSGGIHSYSEDECFEKSELIDTLLKFVIKKINEEQSDVLKARAAIKKLSV